LLKRSLSTDELRLCLREFEKHLFEQLGFALTIDQDTSLDSIEADVSYRFLPDVGFMPVVHDNIESTLSTQTIFSGQELIMMVQLGMVDSTLNSWSRLHKQLIDQLLDYQPLQSRLLWQQQQRYQ
jgi:DNA repair protein RecO (recombination protein O)